MAAQIKLIWFLQSLSERVKKITIFGLFKHFWTKK